MTSTFLKRYYFDDRKIRQRTLLELVRAMDTRRMIAVVGSMASESQGYPPWGEFVSDYLNRADTILDESLPNATPTSAKIIDEAKRLVRDMREASTSNFGRIDARVALGAVKEMMRLLDEQRAKASDLPREAASSSEGFSEKLDLAAADVFRDARPVLGLASNVALRLLGDLGISRFLTLNYDMELELATMAPGSSERASSSRGGDADVQEPSAYRTIDRMVRDGTVVRDERVAHRLTRTLPEGIATDSDVFDRERPDRLFEFAIGSAQADRHVFHLHGRACTPSTMVVGTRDYDRLYRRTHPSRLPFREGLRVLFGGNPILFVGLGMSEAEVNETLQAFVSDNPYRYQAPVFLLWNTWDNSFLRSELRRQKRAARIDWMMRLGVFVIFDDELGSLGNCPRALRILEARRRIAEGRLVAGRKGRRRRSAESRESRNLKLGLLAKTVEALQDEVAYVRSRMRSTGARFRDTRLRIEGDEHSSEDEASGRVRSANRDQIGLWMPLDPPETEGPPLPPPLSEKSRGERRRRPLILVGPSGIGKGALARSMMNGAYEKRLRNRMLVNAGFCYDADSLADALVRFVGRLHRIVDGPLSDRNPRVSRERLLEHEEAFRCAPGLIVINGIDRFFATDGIPLSVEFDRLLRRLAQSREGSGNLRFVLLGTPRVRRYFEGIGGCDIRDLETASEPDVGERVGNRYLEAALAKMYASANGMSHPSASQQAHIEATKHSGTRRDEYVRALVVAILDRGAIRNLKIDPDVALTILRTLAFIGMPVEAVVLLHAPAVRTLLRKPTEGSLPSALPIDEAADELLRILDALKEAMIVIEFEPFGDYPGTAGRKDASLWRRFGLHRAVLGELRERHGIPLSRSKRATAFNMSLYVAQPVDSDTPEPETHDELALLIDRLIGAYKDEPASGELPIVKLDVSLEVVDHEVRSSRPPLSEPPETLRRLLAPAAVACLRAALAVVRGYYSTTTLLSIDRGQRMADPGRDGALLEHAERLERLLRGYRRLSRFRDAWVEREFKRDPSLVPGTEKEWKQRTKRMGSIGPEPFYADEIVWLMNEIGTVRLAQGDLYSAHDAFDRALEVNRSSVEFGCRSHNWRRIMLNSVVVEIERGRLSDVDIALREIERTVDDRVAPGCATAEERRSTRIVRIFAKPGEHDEEPSAIHREFLHEEILVVAIVRCIRGLGEHLRGHLRTAKVNYLDGIRILRRLGEHRAYALFQRYYAQLLRGLGDFEGHRTEIGLAVAAAESVRQMDFAYPARMIQAEPSRGAPIDGEYLRQAIAARDYSALTDNHRVGVEASTRLARAKLASGDYEMALDHAADALSTAIRFDMSLRKIGLRILVGQILLRRGDRRAGTAMIDAAIGEADRIDYQRAVARAQEVRATEAVLF